MSNGMSEALGMAQAEVFGISSRTHFAQVLLEADYRMKLIGIGLEPKPVEMVTFIEAIKIPRQSVLQRWWFAPNYDCLRVTEDGMAFEIVGQGVQLDSQDKQITPDGRILAMEGEPSAANLRYATSFTAKYETIADRVPVFADLRNMIDLAIAAAHMQHRDYFGAASWTMELLRDENQLSVQTCPEPRRVPCVVNAVWKRNRLVAPAGGVTIEPAQAWQPAHLIKDQDGAVSQRRDNIRATIPDDGWWWNG
jgi:hypothetical protein